MLLRCVNLKRMPDDDTVPAPHVYVSRFPLNRKEGGREVRRERRKRDQAFQLFRQFLENLDGDRSDHGVAKPVRSEDDGVKVKKLPVPLPGPEQIQSQFSVRDLLLRSDPPKSDAIRRAKCSDIPQLHRR